MDTTNELQTIMNESIDAQMDIAELSFLISRMQSSLIMDTKVNASAISNSIELQCKISELSRTISHIQITTQEELQYIQEPTNAMSREPSLLSSTISSLHNACSTQIEPADAMKYSVSDHTQSVPVKASKSSTSIIFPADNHLHNNQNKPSKSDAKIGKCILVDNILANKKDILDLFERFGEIIDVKLNLGVKNCVVTFKETFSAEAAILEMNGYFFKDKVVRVRYPNSEIFIRNIGSSTPKEIRTLCQKFGEIVDIRLPDGFKRNFGFVTFKTSHSATMAIHELNGYIYRNKELYVSYKKE